MKYKKLNEYEEHEHENASESPEQTGTFIAVPEMRMLSLYGEVDEKKSANIVSSMLIYRNIKKITPADKNNPPKKYTETTEPLDFIVSTHGGSAADMFSIYDTMKMVEKNMEIHTLGLGKVMSAGVLILAAGTKGKRKIGKNCRVMIHSVIGGAAGSSHDVKNEIEEIFFTQEKYIKCLAAETKLTSKQINEFLSEKRNIYLSAQEAIKYGIADKIA